MLCHPHGFTIIGKAFHLVSDVLLNQNLESSLVSEPHSLFPYILDAMDRFNQSINSLFMLTKHYFLKIL